MQLQVVVCLCLVSGGWGQDPEWGSWAASTSDSWGSQGDLVAGAGRAGRLPRRRQTGLEEDRPGGRRGQGAVLNVLAKLLEVYGDRGGRGEGGSRGRSRDEEEEEEGSRGGREEERGRSRKERGDRGKPGRNGGGGRDR